MARTKKQEEFMSKRRAILDAAQRLVLTKGFEQMSIQDLLDEVHISPGAFHHYFVSRSALLDALIDLMQEEALKPFLPIIHDPILTAIQKFQSYFGTLERLRNANRDFLSRMLNVWYHDSNAVIRQKEEDAIFRRRVPLLVAIVRQGIEEGVFTTAYPDQTGEAILALLRRMENTQARIILAFEQDGNVQRCVEGMVTTHAAYMDALERVLGAPPNSFDRADASAVMKWITAEQADAR